MKKAIDILMDEVDGRGEYIDCLEKLTGLMASSVSHLVDMLILAQCDPEFLDDIDFDELYDMQIQADSITRDYAPEYLNDDGLFSGIDDDI